MENEFFKISFEGVITEIRAGKVIFPKTQEDYMWNAASDRAIRICSLYKDGEGLFQINAAAKERERRKEDQ